MGKQNIWKTYNYYAGTLYTPSDDFVRDEYDDVLVFDTVAEAGRWIDDAESSVYHLSHGEAGRPGYKVVPQEEYTSITDAHTALINSGVEEWFEFEQLDQDGEVVRWMYDNDATPEQAADHFGVS